MIEEHTMIEEHNALKQNNPSQNDEQSQQNSQQNSQRSPQHPQQRYRTVARVAAVQALFQSEHNHDDIEVVIQQFLDYRILNHRTQGAEPANTLYEEGYVLGVDKKLFQQIVRYAWQNKNDLLKEIRKVLPKTWSLERLDPVLRAIFLAAYSEGKYSDVAVAVLMNEYIDIAHGFFSGSEPQLVNGVLDTLFHTRIQQEHSDPLVSEEKVFFPSNPEAE